MGEVRYLGDTSSEVWTCVKNPQGKNPPKGLRNGNE